MATTAGMAGNIDIASLDRLDEKNRMAELGVYIDSIGLADGEVGAGDDPADGGEHNDMFLLTGDTADIAEEQRQRLSTDRGGDGGVGSWSSPRQNSIRQVQQQQPQEQAEQAEDGQRPRPLGRQSLEAPPLPPPHHPHDSPVGITDKERMVSLLHRYETYC